MPVSAMNAMRTADTAEIHARKIKKTSKKHQLLRVLVDVRIFFLLFFFLSFIVLVSLVKIGVKQTRWCTCVCLLLQ